LLVTDGARRREVMLVGTLVVGRDPTCDITGSDDLLSRRHAEFTTSGGRAVVRDLGSRNGVFVNAARVAEAALKTDDLVQIGSLRIQYVEDAQPIAASLPVSAPMEPVEEDVTGYRPAPAAQSPQASSLGGATLALDGDDITSFVPAKAAPPPPRPSPALAPTAVLDEQVVRDHLAGTAPGGRAAQAPSAPQPAAWLVAPGVLVAIGASAFVVWQSAQAGTVIRVALPLAVALAGAAFAGLAIGRRSAAGRAALRDR
jgi:hypothetical protein